MNPKTHRQLTRNEIDILIRQGCHAESWDLLRVKDPFDPERIQRVDFHGINYLGSFQGEVTFPGGFKRATGIYDACLFNCLVEDEVYIRDIRSHVANYCIRRGAVIRQVHSIVKEGDTTFGNGEQISVLNEAGGREVPMYDGLSAHLAYIMALYRHRPGLIRRLSDLIERYADGCKSERGEIGPGSRIINTERIYNTRIGAHTYIEGVTLLEEGSVNSSADDPVRLGFNLSARHFIISSGAVLNDGVILERCFIGQGVELGKQYSAENSLFFANCIGFHGEACAVFAGPYTVTHHKSTLLISGLFSFLNAGSGSNQSNHMYKLGPIHQGIIERGSKTTSDSYLLWPAKVGPFTLIMGRHYKNSDTSLLPFSYLVENNDESILAPGVNLRSVGTIRDARKWPRRDRRKDPVLLDQINYNLLSPFTIQKMWRGREILGNLQQASGKKSEYYFYENTKIPRSALERGIRLYTIGIRKFLGNSLLSVLEKNSVKDFKNLKAKLDPVSAWGKGEWVDLSGLIVPVALVNSFSDRLEEGEITRLDEIQAEFRLWHERYYEMEWTWARDYLEREFNQTVDEMQPDDIIRIIEIWKKAVVDLDEMLYEDARKEFRLSAKTGFGTDGGEDEKLKDFEQVRGDFEQNPSVAAIRQHIIRKSELGDRMIRKIRDLR